MSATFKRRVKKWLDHTTMRYRYLPPDYIPGKGSK